MFLLLLALLLEIVSLEMMVALMLLESLLMSKSPFLLVAASAQLCKLPLTVQNILLVIFPCIFERKLYPVLCVSLFKRFVCTGARIDAEKKTRA